TINAGNSVIRGLAINRFQGDGIAIHSKGNTITGNFIGTDPRGVTALSNGGGVVLGGTSITLADNLISGHFNERHSAAVSDNLIDAIRTGLTAAATPALGRENGFSGIQLVQSPGNTIRGNVISGNGVRPHLGGAGINFAGSPSQGNLIQGNLIG